MLCFPLPPSCTASQAQVRAVEAVLAREIERDRRDGWPARRHWNEAALFALRWVLDYAASAGAMPSADVIRRQAAASDRPGARAALRWAADGGTDPMGARWRVVAPREVHVV